MRVRSRFGRIGLAFLLLVAGGAIVALALLRAPAERLDAPDASDRSSATRAGAPDVAQPDGPASTRDTPGSLSAVAPTAEAGVDDADDPALSGLPRPMLDPDAAVAAHRAQMRSAAQLRATHPVTPAPDGRVIDAPAPPRPASPAQ